MNALLVAPILLPIIGAALCILFGRSRTFQRIVSLSVLTAVTVIAVVLLVIVDNDGTQTTQLGGWPAPIGISLVADRFAVIMLTIGSIVLLAVLVYAIGQPGAERNHVGFQSLYLVLAAGVAGSFLTGDLFNLFVAFEMMLTASYVLITLGGRADQVRSGMTYVVIGLIASILFLAALALLYSATGTVNMADLSVKLQAVSPGMRNAFSVLLLVVFGIKAGLFPLFFWLPDSYPTAPSPVTAIFAGLLTKVGVYAIIRTQTLLFPGDQPSTLILVIAGLTMFVGVLGAIAQADVKRILSFHIISQIGYMIMGLGLFSVAGLAGAVFYIIHHIIVKTSLFLTGGLVEHVGGSSRLNRVGGMVRTAPVLAVLFLVPALSLAGIPPFSGFVAKFSLVSAGTEAHAAIIVGVSLLVGLFTLFSMMKIWAGVFWNSAEKEPDGIPHEVGRIGGPVLMIGATAALVICSLGVAVAAGPLYALSERTAQDLLDPSSYVNAVFPAMSSFTVGVVSLVVWVLLWGELTLGNLVSGIVVAGLLMLVFPNDGPLWPSHFFHPVHALRFLGYFLKSIVASNLVLSREIVSRHSRIQTGVVVVPMPDCSPAMITFIANVTALTPGTMAVEASNEPPELSVHVLQLFDVDEARAGVDKLRYLAVRAFGSPQARADCVRLIEPGNPAVSEPSATPTPATPPLDAGDPT